MNAFNFNALAKSDRILILALATALAVFALGSGLNALADIGATLHNLVCSH